MIRRRDQSAVTTAAALSVMISILLGCGALGGVEEIEDLSRREGEACLEDLDCEDGVLSCTNETCQSNGEAFRDFVAPRDLPPAEYVESWFGFNSSDTNDEDFAVAYLYLSEDGSAKVELTYSPEARDRDDYPGSACTVAQWRYDAQRQVITVDHVARCEETLGAALGAESVFPIEVDVNEASIEAAFYGKSRPVTLRSNVLECTNPIAQSLQICYR